MAEPRSNPFFPNTELRAAETYRGNVVPWEYDYATGEGGLAWPKIVTEPLKHVRDTAQMAGGQKPIDEKTLTDFILDWMMMGSAGAASRPGLGVFGGSLGRRNLDIAEHGKAGFSTENFIKAKQGFEWERRSGEDVWKETGWFQGKDGKWRFEIEDLPATYNPEFVYRAKEGNISAGRTPGSKVEAGNAFLLGELLDHPVLYRAYPDLSSLPVVIVKELPGGVNAVYNPAMGIILTEQIAKNRREGKRTLLHEIQHYVQEQEGFLGGGSSKDIPLSARMLYENQLPGRGILQSPFEFYRRMAGEVEARNVEERSMPFSEAWGDVAGRKPIEFYPHDTADIPLSEQIPWSRFGGRADSIRGYHGSPYRFEPVKHNPFGEFRTDKIGTGEGVQAYGHGHYVGGRQEIGEYYQNALTELETKAFVDDIPLDEAIQSGKWPGELSILADAARGEFSDILNHPIKDSRDVGIILGRLKSTPFVTEADKQGIDAALLWLDDNAERLSWKKPEGSLYTVDIDLEPEQLLDWDSAVPAELKNKVLELAKTKHGAYASDFDRLMKIYGGPEAAAMSGNRFYKDLSDFLPVAKTSELLAEAGIPGIKYLDQGSRDLMPTIFFGGKPFDFNAIPENKAAWSSKDRAMAELYTQNGDVDRAIKFLKEGSSEKPDYPSSARWLEDNRDNIEIKTKDPTYNYVVFDPKHLKIIARNGVPLERVEGNPFVEALERQLRNAEATGNKAEALRLKQEIQLEKKRS